MKFKEKIDRFPSLILGRKLELYFIYQHKVSNVLSIHLIGYLLYDQLYIEIII